jgi:hypothetical protein
MPNLQSLTIAFGSFTENGLARLGSNQKLTQLMLNGCELSDNALVHFASLPQLSYLNLMDTTITDEAVPHLVRLRGLASLETSNTFITPDGVAELRQALPKCKIRANNLGQPGESRAWILRDRERHAAEAEKATPHQK